MVNWTAIGVSASVLIAAGGVARSYGNLRALIQELVDEVKNVVPRVTTLEADHKADHDRIIVLEQRPVAHEARPPRAAGVAPRVKATP